VIDGGNRNTRRKPAPAPLCPLQIPLDQTRDRTLAAAVGSQRLTAYAMARPRDPINCRFTSWIPGFMPQFPWSMPVFDHLYAEVTEAVG
jgi:hypothetical protein